MKKKIKKNVKRIVSVALATAMAAVVFPLSTVISSAETVDFDYFSITTDSYGKLGYSYVDMTITENSAYTADVRDISSNGGYGVFDNLNASGWNSTFFYHNGVGGWETTLKSGDYDDVIKTAPSSETLPVYNGLQVGTDFDLVNEGQLLKIQFNVTNTTDTAKTFSLLSGGDTQVRGNDSVSVTTYNAKEINGYNGMKVYDSDYSLLFFAKDATYKAFNWSNYSEILKKTDAGTAYYDLIVADTSACENDSAGVWYWDDQTVEANSTKTLVAYVGIFPDANGTQLTEDEIKNIKDETASDFTITFNTDGGSKVNEMTNQSALPSTLPTTEKTGYTLEGWYTDEACTTPAVAGTAITADITLYAKWTEDTASLTFDANGGTSAPDTVTMKYSEATTLPAAITRDGYTFDGWNTKADGSGTNYEAGATFKAADTEPVATTLYAKWVANVGTVAILEEKQKDNVGGGKLAGTLEEIKSVVLADTDQTTLANGKDINIWLTITDITSSVSDTDKNLVAAKLPENYTAGAYFDVNLWKQVTGEDAVKVTELPNGKVKVSFTVPDSLWKDGRTFKIIRIHNGEAEAIETTIDSDHVISFETDRFSTYAIAYEVSSAPKTGDTTPLAGVLVLMIASAAGAIVLKKKVL